MKTQSLRPANRAKTQWFASVAALAMIASSRAAAVHDAGPVLTEATRGTDALRFNMGDISGFSGKVKSSEINKEFQINLKRAKPGS
jgi:hypothetical protein